MDGLKAHYISIFYCINAKMLFLGSIVVIMLLLTLAISYSFGVANN